MQHMLAYIAFGIGRERLGLNRCGAHVPGRHMAAGPEDQRFDAAARSQSQEGNAMSDVNTTKPKAKPVTPEIPKFEIPRFEIPKFEMPKMEVPAAFRELAEKSVTQYKD